MLPSINLFGYTVYVFLLSILTGIVVGNWQFARLLRRRLGASEPQVLSIQAILTAAFLLGGLGGNALMYGTDGENCGGYSVMGSVLLLGLVIPWVARITGFKHQGRRILDFASASFLATQVIGKVGCFAAGCCFGTRYDGPLAVSFPWDSAAPPVVHLHPVQLYEAAALLVLWFICRRVLARDVAPGTVTGVFLIGKGIERFMAEFLRGDAVQSDILGLTTAQWAAIACLAGGIVYLALRNYRATQAPAVVTTEGDVLESPGMASSRKVPSPAA